MALDERIIPNDSILKSWLAGLDGLETPRSYLLLTAMSAIGCLLKRNVWVDQERWKVYPNMSIFLVGPSGIGKDTAIDEGVALVENFGGNILYGRTVEQQAITMVKAGESPTCWLVPGPEATAFFGKKEYQGGKLEFWTDILTTKRKYDFSSRTDGKITIEGPTITMMLGSTSQWLQRNMPDGTLEGGFFPRFVVDNENEPAKHVPLIKHSCTYNESKLRRHEINKFYAAVRKTIDYYQERPMEIALRKEAIDFYTNWYYNRFNYFAPGVREYANRSRDQLLRLAMLSGIMRGKHYMDVTDMKFAHNLLQYTTSSLEEAIKPQSIEQRCQTAYLSVLKDKGNQPRFSILNVLRRTFDYTTIQKAEAQLFQSQVIGKNTEGHLYIRD
jgi:hypothetical protein